MRKMTKRLTQAFVALAVLGAGVQSTYAGIGGAGNTADISIQIEFVRATAIQILKAVTPRDLPASPKGDDLQQLYSACRQTMLIDALKTKIRLVDEIPDGGDYHALARRVSPDVTELSRTELDKMMKNGVFSASVLTALFIHEVGHDCIYNGRPVDDSFDPMLNELGASLVSTYNAQSLTGYIDVDFVSKVKSGAGAQPFHELSSSARKQIARKFIDYLGDWLYIENHAFLGERPAPASDFYATSATSFFPGWGVLNSNRGVSTPIAMNLVINNLLKASFETGSISFFDGKRNAPLPTRMDCSYLDNVGNSLSGAKCQLQISWSNLLGADVSKSGVSMEFQIDLAGEVKFIRLQMLR
jgi:hypothetical protein